MGSINQIAFGSGIAAVRVPMAKPSWAVVRAELPKAPDLFAERSIPRGGSSSSRRRDLVFVVNPKGLFLSLFFVFGVVFLLFKVLLSVENGELEQELMVGQVRSGRSCFHISGLVLVLIAM